MPRVIYGISPIGLGHATRSIEIIRRLKGSGVDVRLFSGGVVVQFLRANGLEAEDLVSDPVPFVSNGVMKRAAIWYIRSWLALGRSSPRVRLLFDSYKPDLVVCDEELSGVTVAENNRAKRVLISDELELGFARTWFARRLEARVERWYARLLESVDLLIIPDFGVDSGNKRYVGPVVRERTMSGAETRRAYGLPLNGNLVLLSMSGSGIGDFLLEATLRGFREMDDRDALLVVTGNRGRKINERGVIDLGIVRDNQNLVGAAALVVSTAGKSTIDEAASSGTPLIAIPIKNHAEQERNAAALGYRYDDLGRIGQLMASKIGRTEIPRTFRGAENASRLILSML
jgi:UDP-N-acetylglucosamine--N-acetylmuramyl-(pentapeptide) pyrophosphoryl-undecaprenol N-acetylglucosamine transferase